MRRRSLDGRSVLVVLRLCWRSFRCERGYNGGREIGEMEKGKKGRGCDDLLGVRNLRR